MARINIIAAIDANRAIGLNNRLLFHIPEDMAHFKQLTTGHTIIMGRRTFESLPNGALPHRRNIIVSRTLSSIAGAEVYGSVAEAVAACYTEEDIYIIGGEEIYRQTIGIAHRLYLTIIDQQAPHADAWFPDYHDWTLKGETQRMGFRFALYEREEITK